MADRYWLDVDTDWNNTSNWTSGAVPATGDRVFITSGSKNITANIDQSAVNLALLQIGGTYTGTVGNSTSDTLIVGATRVSITGTASGGTGNIYLTTGGTYGFDKVAVTQVGNGGSLYIGGTIGTLVARHGLIHLLSGTTTTEYLQAASAGNIVFTNEGGTITTLHEQCATLYQTSGTITTLRAVSGTATITGGTLTTAIVEGATVDWSASGTVTLATVIGGTMYARGGTQTITDASVYYGATLDISGGPVTLTNPVAVYGGTFLPPAGSTVTVS